MTSKLNNNTNTPAPTFYTVEALLTQDRYSIPMYQRNYAWADQEISQLIDDVLDYQTKTSYNDNYYIGTLVVYKKESNRDGESNCYEVIDGQQRLTTLSLLAMYLKNYAATDAAAWYQNKVLNLSFECRTNSTFTLQALFDNEDFGEYSHFNDEAAYARINSDILNGYKIIEKTLSTKINERGSTLAAFSDYVRQHVKILRVEVPKDTDLNHYFEVMNNRGEQLEKYEIIKARLLECVQADSHAVSVINTVWEGVANMEKYIQSTFSTSTDVRAKIFGKDYDDFLPTDFETLSDFFDKAKAPDETKAPEDTRQTIIEILASDSVAVQDNAYSKDSERFRSVINFPNFLLQVLRVYIYGIQKIAPSLNDDGKVGDTVSLDDKALIDAFEEHILRHKDADKVKAFIFYLLKSKFVFDKYIIKRQYQHGDESWSLKKYIKSDDKSANVNNTFGKDEEAASRGEGNNDARSTQNQQNIVMLLASFHVSIPSMSYKYWLNGALTWLMSNDDDTQITATDYLTYLHGMAQSFVFDRYLSDTPLDYYHIVYDNHCQPQNIPNSIAAIRTELLTYGRIKNNFVFNYLDYLIWRKKCDSDAVYKRFEFTFRSSVEHFYPQTAHTFESMEKATRDRFGNLFLITHSQNSSFSNKRPLAKLGEIKGQYLTSSDIGHAIPSLKLIELAKALKPQWDDNTENAEKYAVIFEQHEKDMLALYIES